MGCHQYISAWGTHPATCWYHDSVSCRTPCSGKRYDRLGKADVPSDQRSRTCYRILIRSINFACWERSSGSSCQSFVLALWLGTGRSECTKSARLARHVYAAPCVAVHCRAKLYIKGGTKYARRNGDLSEKVVMYRSNLHQGKRRALGWRAPYETSLTVAPHLFCTLLTHRPLTRAM